MATSDSIPPNYPADPAPRDLNAVPTLRDTLPTNESAVSWSAVFAGAAAAVIVGLLMLMLGASLGLASVSPWANTGASAATIGVAAIVWLTLTQLLSSALGGYLAGRLRTKWVGLHGDETYFRDTAHGFLAWTVASLATAVLLTSVVTGILSGGASVAAATLSGTAQTVAAGAGAAATSAASQSDASTDGPIAYYIDTMFRPSADSTATGAPSPAQGNGPASTAEVARIIINNIGKAQLPAEDARYVARLVAQRTGLSPQEAQKRVTDTYAQLQTQLQQAMQTAKEAADEARKASAYTTLWMLVTLLIGAFVASASATFGGRQRDS